MKLIRYYFGMAAILATCVAVSWWYGWYMPASPFFIFFAIVEPFLWCILNAVAGYYNRKSVLWISIAIAFVMALVLGRFVPGSEERLLRSFIIILSNIGWSMSGFVEGVIVRQFKKK